MLLSTYQKRKARESRVPVRAPLWLAAVVAMPRVNRPSRGPPTTPKMVREA